MQRFFGIFPDVHVANDPYPVQFGAGDWITVVTRVTGTFTGQMTLPGGSVVAPTGRAAWRIPPGRPAGDAGATDSAAVKSVCGN